MTRELLERAQAFVDRKYTARADDRQRAMGLSYVTAERVDLAREMARFAVDEINRALVPNVPHKREESKNIFGYFDSADQTKPAFDPGLDVMCPFCLKKLTLPVRTTSLWADGDDRSFFYRAHRDCADAATPEQETQIEGSLIDSRAALIPNDGKSDG